MKDRTGCAALVFFIFLFSSCVSTPEARNNSLQVDENTSQKSIAQETLVPETVPSLAQSVPELALDLSEPPVLFPEASTVPVQPSATQKKSTIVLPVPEIPATSSGDKNNPSTSTASTKPNGATLQKNAPAGTATGSASTAGSTAAAEKKSVPVDPKTLKAPEPQPETKVAQEKPAMPVGGIPELPSKSNPALAEEKVVLSRSVRATVGQLVEIPYQGTGWVYLGEVAGKKGLAYDSRRLDPDGQTFVFRCEGPGTYTVKFFKQDFIKDYIINDYVEVVVGESPVTAASVTGAFSLPVDRGRVVANPRWPAPAGTASAAPATTASTGTAALTSGAAASTAPAPAAGTTTAPTASAASAPTAATSSVTATTAPAAPVSSGTASSSNSATAAVTPANAANSGGSTQTNSSTAPAVQSSSAVSPLENLSQPEEFINLAKKEVASGQYAAALETLQAFTARYPAGSDEAWWLFGQIFEAKGPQRDIKSALSYYKRLTVEYPQSQRYDEAQQRIAYLERFYFDIR
ncbi:tetratricopeptide repeat protein [Gracilinema caldarium]|uniref:Outer membrane lipoprotein BamD-like domain-containing protein n=1 Tax=Gracilinema caldarium (strain ATCC 51460 / DSM 7334 / H1) TaxID=744872 RepID=F8F183_GRAC1|nr:hypothetical protein [Gracilinema caldarium]AEJ18727.1 hypothetical protein Spica_0567 [Gracilinema caldarium DSM 7334]